MIFPIDGFGVMYKNLSMKRKEGRPSKYPTINQELIKKLYLNHLTDEQVADCLNINQESLQEYKKLYPEFSKSIRDWKDEADKKVEEALYHRAVGYSHKHEEIFCSFGKVTRAKTIKHYAPSEVAAMFWLKNRKPDQWRDQQKEVSDVPLDEELQLRTSPKDENRVFKYIQ